MRKSILIIGLFAIILSTMCLAYSDRSTTTEPNCCYNNTGLTVLGYHDKTNSRCYGYNGSDRGTFSQNRTTGYISDEGFCETLSGMPAVGSDIGSFVSNMSSGVGTFLVVMTLFLAIGGLIVMLIGVIKGKFE